MTRRQRKFRYKHEHHKPLRPVIDPNAPPPFYDDPNCEMWRLLANRRMKLAIKLIGKEAFDQKWNDWWPDEDEMRDYRTISDWCTQLIRDAGGDPNDFRIYSHHDYFPEQSYVTLGLEEGVL